MKTKFTKGLIRVVVICLVSFFALLGTGAASQAPSLVDVASMVKTPEALAGWLNRDFLYELALADGWNSPEETIKFKKGDCDDFAVLAKAVLKELGIRSDIVVLKFSGLSVAHAICLWKDARGNISFISNQKLFQTAEPDISRALRKYYPDIEAIIYMDEGMRYAGSEKAR